MIQQLRSDQLMPKWDKEDVIINGYNRNSRKVFVVAADTNHPPASCGWCILHSAILSGCTALRAQVWRNLSSLNQLNIFRTKSGRWVVKLLAINYLYNFNLINCKNK